DQGRLRCLNAATGELLWEAPISGSPSWARQMPPVVYKNLAIYMFSTGRFGPEVPETEKVKWFFGSQKMSNFPDSYRPLVRAYDLDSGKEVWTVDFSEYGRGGDAAGLCLMDDKLYYSTYFGREPQLRGAAGPHGMTASLDPQTGKILWVTTKHSIHGGCTISGENGRLYMGGYNPLAGTNTRHVWCLDARDGSLIWQSEPLLSSTHVVTIGPKFLLVHAHSEISYLLDKQTGKVIATPVQGYRCTRFTLNGNYLLAPNMDIIDLSNPEVGKIVATGPRLDTCECTSACVSNGRLFYTGHGGTLQASLVSSEAAP
ncbi:MAG TPA: PQQ-binding-like beta-propeller repeat protein, partial [Sedimentisphaerales bacterium]|nr:PQQ-binding-like beta-propeller repeat protein [Sedimentisphaerales bacterium]